MVIKKIVFHEDESIGVVLYEASPKEEKRTSYKGHGKMSPPLRVGLEQLEKQVCKLLGIDNNIAVTKLAFQYAAGDRMGVSVVFNMCVRCKGVDSHCSVVSPFITESNTFKVYPQIDMPGDVAETLFKILAAAREYTRGMREQTELKLEAAANERKDGPTLK